ncbi:MAG: hypothetical protein K0R18_1670 [Bacillales bacterium]|jgi:hypothetical protein|nr:hypothetical protein [Bacillales bacterium]
MINLKPWTDKQLQILKNNAGKIKTDELAKMIGKSVLSVQQRACRDGISLKTTINHKRKKVIKNTGCNYEKVLPREQWNKAKALLGMMGKLKSVIPCDVKPVLDLEQLQKAFAIRERAIYG